MAGVECTLLVNFIELLTRLSRLRTNTVRFPHSAGGIISSQMARSTTAAIVA